jgi:hypothetical protein
MALSLVIDSGKNENKSAGKEIFKIFRSSAKLFLSYIQIYRYSNAMKPANYKAFSP